MVIIKTASSRLLVSLLLLLSIGCASIINGTRQKVAVSSNPPGATVSDGEVSLVTPATFELKRNCDHLITITKPGYETETVKVVHVVSGAVAGNLLAGGLIGWGVDATSGAQWRLEPETLSVTLRPLRPGEKVDESTRPTLATIEKKLNELRALKENNVITDDEYACMRDLAIRSVEYKASPIDNKAIESQSSG
jgi:hypothetical protein